MELLEMIEREGYALLARAVREGRATLHGSPERIRVLVHTANHGGEQMITPWNHMDRSLSDHGRIYCAPRSWKTMNFLTINDQYGPSLAENWIYNHGCVNPRDDQREWPSGPFWRYVDGGKIIFYNPPEWLAGLT